MARKLKKSVKKVRKPAKKTVSKKRPAKAKTARKTVKKSLPKLPEFPWRSALKGEKFMGIVEDFFGHIGVVAFTLKVPLKIGDTLHIRGHTSDFKERVTSMQIEHASVTSASVGDSVGIKVGQKSRKGDYVYKAK